MFVRWNATLQPLVPSRWRRQRRAQAMPPVPNRPGYRRFGGLSSLLASPGPKHAAPKPTHQPSAHSGRPPQPGSALPRPARRSTAEAHNVDRWAAARSTCAAFASESASCLAIRCSQASRSGDQCRDVAAHKNPSATIGRGFLLNARNEGRGLGSSASPTSDDQAGADSQSPDNNGSRFGAQRDTRLQRSRIVVVHVIRSVADGEIDGGSGNHMYIVQRRTNRSCGRLGPDHETPGDSDRRR